MSVMSAVPGELHQISHRVLSSNNSNNELAKSTLSEDVISLVTDAPLELLHCRCLCLL